MATRQQWAIDFLHAIGNANPSPNVVNWVVAWEGAENTQAKNNPLATTQDMQVAGQTTFNSVGVRNYPDYQTGIRANAIVLQNGYYPDLYNALRTNNEAALGYGTGAYTSPIVRQLQTWCGNCGQSSSYGNLFARGAGQGAGLVVPGTENVNPSPSPSPSPSPMPNPSPNPVTTPTSNPTPNTSSCAWYDVPCALNAYMQSYTQFFLNFAEAGAVAMIAIIMIVIGIFLLNSQGVTKAVKAAISPQKAVVKAVQASSEGKSDGESDGEAEGQSDGEGESEGEGKNEATPKTKTRKKATPKEKPETEKKAEPKKAETKKAASA